jgi:multisubunit Na+/H+ antiporter MnhB subunit
VIGLAFDLVLCTLVVGSAVAAVAGRQMFASVVFFIVYGLLIALAWVRLGAVDVALAEAAIGAGLTGVLLVAASARLARLADLQRPPAPDAGDPGRGAQMLAGLAATAVAGVIGHGLLALDPAGAGLGERVAGRQGEAGVGNPVTAVLLNFRAYDTLLESIVLLVALVGVWSLAQDDRWGGVPGLPQHVRPGGVLATFGRLLPPLGLLVGLYLVWTGADQPGGAFQGGTVLAATWLLLAMAALARAPRVSHPGLRAALVAGPMLFLAIGVAGALLGSFLGFAPAHAKALILAIELTLMLSIAATLALLVLGPPQPEDT